MSGPDDTAGGRYVPGALASALIGSLPLLVFFCVVPVQIYIGNQAYFEYRVELPLHLGLIYLAGAAVLYGLFRVAPRTRRAVAYPLAALGAAMLAVYLVDPPELEAIRGGLPELDEPVLGTVLEAGGVAVLFALAWRLGERSTVGLLAWFCGLLLVAMPLVLAVMVLAVEPAARAWPARSAPPVQETDSFNIYHVVLDGYDGTEFERVVDALGLRDDFGGFTWYPNAYTNYTLTLLSFPSFMTGEMRDEQTSEEGFRERARRGGMLAALDDRSYFITQYSAFPVNRHERTRHAVTPRAVEQPLYGNLRLMAQLLDITTLQAVPTPLRADVTVNGRGPFARWLAGHGREIADWSRNRPLLNVLLFRRMVAEEAGRPGRGQYVGAHLVIPHAPYTLDSDCGYDPSRGASLATRLDQTACATRLLTELIAALEHDGKYAESLILVHSDHGDAVRERPLLLVKPPGMGRDRPLAVDGATVQLLDVVPTVYDHLGIDRAGLRGAPLHSPAARAPRDIRVISPLDDPR